MNPQLYLVMPVFSRDPINVTLRMDAYQGWFGRSANKLRANFGIDFLDAYALFEEKTLELASGLNIIYRGAGSGVPKGLAVRAAIAAILDKIDGPNGNSVVDRRNAYVIIIDGSGAFHLDSFFKVLEALQKNERAVILGRRPGPTWLMNHIDRKKIELFENYILSQWYEIKHSQPLSLLPYLTPKLAAGGWPQAR